MAESKGKAEPIPRPGLKVVLDASYGPLFCRQAWEEDETCHLNWAGTPTLPGICEARIGTPLTIASLTAFAPPSWREEITISRLDASNRSTRRRAISPSQR